MLRMQGLRRWEFCLTNGTTVNGMMTRYITDISRFERILHINVLFCPSNSYQCKYEKGLNESLKIRRTDAT